MSKSLTFLDILASGFVSGFGYAQSLRCDANAPGVQHRHCDFEALPFLAETVFNRHFHIVKADFAGSRSADAEFGLFFAAHQAGAVAVHDEGGDPAVPLFGIGHGKHHEIVRYRPAGDPVFAPVEDVVVAFAGGARAHICRIRAGGRLGQRICADGLPRRDRHNVLLLLLLGAVFEDAVAEKRIVDRHDGAVSGVNFADFGLGEHISKRIHARAAVFLRHFNPHKAHLAHFADGFHRKFTAFVVFSSDWGNFLLGKFARRLLNHAVFIGENVLKCKATHFCLQRVEFEMIAVRISL